MSWIKRAGLGLLIILIAVGLLLASYVYRSLPTLDGELAVPGLGDTVGVTRDDADVTHIHAATPHDAWFALGYVHAQERGWQLEFNRRVMRGQLSEVFGEATVPTDRLLRTLGIMRAAQKQLEGLPPEVTDALRAYADGINAFHANGAQARSPEFLVLGVHPGPWEPVDSVGWAIMMALDLGGNWGAEFARLSIASRLSTERLWQLMPPYPGEAPASATDFSRLYAQLGVYRAAAEADDAETRNTEAVAAESLASLAAPTPTLPKTRALPAMQAWSDAFVASAGSPHGRGSNNWAVAGSHTESGMPLLANDPHLGLSAPAVWYMAHLEAPGLSVIGATLPGLPFVVLGRTASAAWSFTNTGPDVQDLYLEQINPDDPGQYRTPSGWADFTTREEVIRVKGGDDLRIAVRATRHGPVISDAQASHAELLDTSRYVVALRWTALDDDNHTVKGGLLMNQAKTVDDLIVAGAAYHSPMQSMVMADTLGNVAFKAIGKVPVRHPDNDIQGIAPSPGWDARYDWAGWIPYAETPHDDAGKGWVATANQRVIPPDYPYFMGQDWYEPYRYNRIEQMLAAQPQHNMDSMRRMQGDQYSPATARLLPYLEKTARAARQAAAPNPPVEPPLLDAAIEALANFDSVMHVDSPASLVFAAWADEVTRGVLAPRLGQPLFDTLYGKRHFRAAIEGILANDDAWWCAPLTCLDQSVAALQRALARLERDYGSDVAAWRWGEAHPALSEHNPFSNVAALAPWFEVSVPIGGDNFTVNVGQYWSTGERPFTSRQAASLRTLYDLADLENSWFIYQTGQSGVVFSSRYRDMSEEWAGMRYRPMRMQPARVRHTLTLTPG